MSAEFPEFFVPLKLFVFLFFKGTFFKFLFPPPRYIFYSRISVNCFLEVMLKDKEGFYLEIPPQFRKISHKKLK
jgi:hypothetical protein